LHASPFVLTWNFYAGYLVSRVPTVAPRPTSGEAVNPRVGPTSLFPCCFFRTLYLGIAKREFGFTNGRVATCDSREMLQRVKRLLISPRTADPSGW
jgi:hypothetical protein